MERETNFTGHKLDGTNFRLWRFQITAFMKAHALTDNIEGKVPVSNASEETKATYERKEGRAMNALIQSLDSERANIVLSCTTAKEMIERLSSIYEKNSEIRVMNLYEEYFALKMKEDESVTTYVSKCNMLASEIEAQGEKLSEKLKMIRIISSLAPGFNNFKTVWYNIKETRSLDTLMSSLQLEEDNLKKNEAAEGGSNVAFAAKMKPKFKQKERLSIDELKKRTKCKVCNKVGHWARECPQNKNQNGNKNPSTSNKDDKRDLAFMVVEGEKCKESDVWIADSGASSHMSFHKEWFVEYNEYNEKRVVQIANNEQLSIQGTGTILIEAMVNGRWESRQLKNVLHVPDLKQNLFSTAEVTNKGFKVLITNKGCEVLGVENEIVAIGIKDERNQIQMQFRRRFQEYANAAAVSLQQWHRRLGHINVDSIKKMCRDNLVNGVDLSNNDEFFCEDCQLGKMTRATHKLTTGRPAEKGEFMHADLCGPMEEEGIEGFRYFLLIKDEATSFRYVYFLRSKDEVYDKFAAFIPLVNNTINSHIKHFRFDNGTEFVNRKIEGLLLKKGITWERIVPYTPEQNGRIERDNRTVQESARTMLIASGLQKFLWPEAVRTAIYILNRSTNSKCIGSTPFGKWFGSKPELGHLRIFGTECFVQVPKQLKRKKWDPKSKKVFLVGFEPTTKNFRLFDPDKRKIFISCNVRFNEPEMKTYVIENDESDDRISKTVDHEQEEYQEEDQREEVSVEDQRLDATAGDDVQNASILTEDEDDPQSKDKNGGRTNQRYNMRPNIKAPDRLIATGYSAVVSEPFDYEEAIHSSEREKWQAAIDEELNSLRVNNTWDLVKRPKNTNIVGCKWVFKIKPGKNGEIYKARLVAKGYSQREGIDFNETFSPVVRYETIRTLLAIAATEDLEIVQFDVKTAFLNGTLDMEVYMKIPEGIEAEEGDLVCRLNKSLYGLRQSSRVWNIEFTQFLTKFEMKQSAADNCVFIGYINGHKVILALFVDDGLMLSPNMGALECMRDYLSKKFMITEGHENYYVGMEFIRDRINRRIFVNQRAYIERLIEKFEMKNCRGISTPADNNVVLGKSRKKENEPYPYRQAVGSLMFAAIVSRPDISYAVGVVSRYLENPGPAHIGAVKRIMRYLKDTSDYGIEYGGSLMKLKGFTDSDYARDVDTRRSTTGYVFMLNNGVITWKSYLQKTVAISTAEAEYMAASDGVKEAVWLRQLLTDIEYDQGNSTPLFIDNQSAILLTKNAEFHQRTKHIDVRCHFIRERVKKGDILPMYISTKEQLADALTKPLPAQKFKENILSLGLKKFG